MIYLLNEKAYEIASSKPAKELFKDKALKQYELSDNELRKLNPVQTDDAKKAKVFFYDTRGIARVTFIGSSKCTDWNEHLSHSAYLEGRRKAGY